MLIGMLLCMDRFWLCCFSVAPQHPQTRGNSLHVCPLLGIPELIDVYSDAFKRLSDPKILVDLLDVPMYVATSNINLSLFYIPSQASAHHLIQMLYETSFFVPHTLPESSLLLYVQALGNNYK
jgi:hypothetical protein